MLLAPESVWVLGSSGVRIRPIWRGPTNVTVSRVFHHPSSHSNTQAFQRQKASDLHFLRLEANDKLFTVTQSNFAAPCTPLYDGFHTGLCILSVPNFSHRVFFDAPGVPVAPGTINSSLLTREFTVKDVTLSYKCGIFCHMMTELPFLIVSQGVWCVL
jgi:hypothetical protein